MHVAATRGAAVRFPIAAGDVVRIRIAPKYDSEKLRRSAEPSGRPPGVRSWVGSQICAHIGQNDGLTTTTTFRTMRFFNTGIPR